MIVLVPTTGDIKIVLAQWVSDTRGIPDDRGVGVAMIDRKPVAAARNSLVVEFLKSGEEWALWVDSDSSPRAEMREVVNRCRELNAPIVMVQTALLRGVPAVNVRPWCWEMSERGKEWPTWWIQESFPVRQGGFGLVMTHRSVFENIEPPWFMDVLGWDKKLGPNGLTLWGEDIVFCMKAWAAGYPIWCPGGVSCGHLKSVVDLGALLDGSTRMMRDHGGLPNVWEMEKKALGELGVDIEALRPERGRWRSPEIAEVAVELMRKENEKIGSIWPPGIVPGV